MLNKAELKQAILKQLSTGKAQAITGEKLAFRLCERDTRFMRACISELRQENHPIGMSLSKPAGYYFMETLGELEECMNRSRKYCIENALTRRDFKRIGIKRGWIKDLMDRDIARTGQLSLL